MRNVPRALFVATAVLALVMPMAAGAQAGSPSATKWTENVQGVFRAWFGNCPDDVPAEPMSCTEWDLFAYRNGFTDTTGGAKPPPPKQEWRLLAVHHSYTFPGDFGEPIEYDVLTANNPVQATFDREHLSSATLRADDYPMPDGTTVDIAATFTAYGPRQQYGNDGPELGQPRHQRGDCSNLLLQAHQKYRLAHAVAVIDGIESRYDGRFGFIGYNRYMGIEVHPASCR